MAWTDEGFEEAARALVGSLLADAMRANLMAGEAAAGLRETLHDALSGVLGIAGQDAAARDVFSLLLRTLPSVAAVRWGTRVARTAPLGRDPARLDLFALLGVTPTPEERRELDAAYTTLLRPDLSFLASIIAPPPGFGSTPPSGGGSQPPVDARIGRAIAEVQRRVVEKLNRLGRLIGSYAARMPLRRTVKVATALDREILTLHRRLTIAAFFTTGGTAIDLANEFAVAGDSKQVLKDAWEKIKRSFGRDIGSDIDLGRAIQEKLQAGYRHVHLRPKRLNNEPRYAILQENRVYADRRNPKGVALAEAATGADGSIRALHYARQPYTIVLSQLDEDFENKFREDCLDIRKAELWEIKPMRGAILGVAQELHYRASFNLVNALLQDGVELLGGSTTGLGILDKLLKILNPKLRFSCPDGVRAGVSGAWDPLKGFPHIDMNLKRRGMTIPRVAFVVTIPDQLPGLVFYVVFVVPDLMAPGVSAILAALAATLERLLRRFAEDLRDRIEDIERGVAVAVGLILAAAMVYELFLLAAAVAGAAEAIGAALASAIRLLQGAGLAGGAVLGASTVSSEQATQLVSELATAAFGKLEDGRVPQAVLLADRLLVTYPEPAGTESGDLGVSDVLVGGVLELKHLPVGRWPAICGLLGISVTLGLAALVKAGTDTPPQPSSDSFV